jgi:hypothetical protein
VKGGKPYISFWEANARWFGSIYEGDQERVIVGICSRDKNANMSVVNNETNNSLGNARYDMYHRNLATLVDNVEANEYNMFLNMPLNRLMGT